MKQFYVYIHKKPDGTPFYVGKTGNQRRLQSMQRRNAWHQNIVNKYGAENIIIEVTQAISEKEAFDLERIYIKQLREAGYELANLTDGGEGHSGFKQSEELKQKRAATLKAFYASENGKRVNKALNKYRCGRKNTEETKRKMSAASKGKQKSELHSYNLSVSRVGKPKAGSGIGLAGVNWVASQSCWKVVVCFRGKTTFYGNYKNLLDAAACRIALQAKNTVI